MTTPQQPPDDEFALLAQNAAEVGLPWAGPPAVRRVSTDVGSGQRVSALLWGEDAPRVVLLHGGGQNAHTWDTVVLALGLPALAIDLPGHGHSDWRPDRDYRPVAAAAAVAPVIRELAPAADVVVGMSLGGLTAIRLTRIAADVTRRAVVVDVTPSVQSRQGAMSRAERGTTALIHGPESFASLDEIVRLTAAAAPHRSPTSVWRGVVHNTRRRQDGRWVWRYDRLAGPTDFGPLWDDVSASAAPLVLVRGGASAFVGDDDVAEFVRRSPTARVHVVPGAGHSVQSDAPLALAEIVRSTLG